ncbi:DsbA family oxidoreductase [Lichenifustis flavocetrariae]|uniref:DsbA family oxidoreductase n=1 Tax=Lichenifustis flavocetrariae TaxID=2949735 RepID=A0AA41YUU1_9HYPH|nr:DsbA family oxidoreductase [Lichenifustis flavocetrariae]MCW6508969.1 DsbA family oxidoreductase [Lichenifustis flavocetrariae]
MRAEPDDSPARQALERGVVTVDVVSDVVCPWCFLGKRRLEAAIAQSGEPVDIRWRPFQLDPTIPPAGLDRGAYVSAKFGSLAALDAAHEKLSASGAEEGIAFAFDRIARAPNTIDAHRLIRWALSADLQDAVVEALFQAYFVEGRDIGDRKMLVGLAEAAGMDATLVHRLLASGADEADVRDEIATAVRLGVSGVPFFIFAGRYAVPGAQTAEVLAAAIAKARSEGPMREGA